MAWDRRSRSSSGRRGGPAAMKELECSSSSLQPWACSSLSSSEKFLSLYDKMLEDSEKKNFESLVCTRCLQQAPPAEEERFPSLLPPTMLEKPGSKTVFPHITSKGSLVGKKVYCRTSIHSSITWRQKSSTQRMRTTSLMVLNFYHQDRSNSNNNLLALKQTASHGPHATDDSVTSQKKQDHSPNKEQCRALFLSLAGAAGMRLICPPLQLPLLEILLFFRQQLSSKNRRGLWRFPVNLALATVRPFCGSLLRRCLTAMICLTQMRINKNLTTEQSLRYMPVADLCSVVFEKEHLDRKEFTICSTNLIQIDDPVPTATTKEADLYDGANRVSRDINGTLLSNVVAGLEVEEECCSNGVPVVEILICESLSEINNAPNFVFQDQERIGFRTSCSEVSLFSLADLQLEDDKLASSRRPFLKQKGSEGFVSLRTAGGNVFMATPKQLRSLENGLLESGESRHLTVEEARIELLDELEGSTAFTDKICEAEEEHPECTPVSKTTCTLKATMDECADEPCAPRRGLCNDAATAESLENEAPARVVTVENELVNEFQDGQSVLFVEGDLAEELLELELDACSIEEHKISRSDCVSPERVQEPIEILQPAEASDGNELQEAAVMEPVQELSLALSETVGSEAVKDIEEVKSDICMEDDSADRLLDCPVEQHTSSDCLSAEILEEQVVDYLPNRASAEHELEKAAIPLSEEKLSASTEALENEAVMEINEVELEHYLEGLSSDSVLDCPIEDLIESLLEQTEAFLSRTTSADVELEEPAATVPVEKLLLDSTGAVEGEAFREIQEVKSLLSVEEESAETVLVQELKVCTFEEQPTGDSPCALPERLHDETEDFLLESTTAANELGKGAVMVPVEVRSQALADVVENEDVKEIHEVQSKYAVEGKSAQKVVDQDLHVRPIEDNGMDDGSCISSKRLQEYGPKEVLLPDRASFDNEPDENESPAAMTVPVDSTSLVLTEGLENEAIKEIQEVKSAQLIDGDSKDLLELDHRIGDTDFVLLEAVKRNSDVFLSDWMNSEHEIEKGSTPAADVSLPVEAQSPASTEVLENQPVKEIEEVESTYFANEKSAERVLNQELEACPIDNHEIDRTSYVSLERMQEGHVEVFLPEATSAKNEIKKESPDYLQGRHFDAEFDGEVSVLKQENNSGQEPDLRLSPVMMSAVEDDDFRSEDTSSQYQAGALSKDSCAEHTESNLIYWTGEGVSEPSTHTSITSRLNSATEAENNAFDPNSGAIAGVTDEINRDQKSDEHCEETEGKVLDVINSDSIGAHDDSNLPPGPTVVASLAAVVLPSDDERNLNPSLAVAYEICVNGDDNYLQEMCPITSSTTGTSNSENHGVSESFTEHPFADHPTCIELRERRHTHEDQTYIDMQDLLPAPWGKLIFWHGRCKEGRPTLCVLLGKAVRQLPGHELKHFIAVTVSHVEYAELNYFKGNVKQLNILMDLEGLGFMRLPPMNILSSIGSVLNRDYAGRGGSIILVNAPMMLGFVINAIQGVILRPQHNKGAVIDSSFKGFLEGKEKIMMMGGRYRPVLLRHFDACMLPNVLGGECTCSSQEEPCKLGIEFLKLPWNTSSEVWALREHENHLITP